MALSVVRWNFYLLITLSMIILFIFAIDYKERYLKND